MSQPSFVERAAAFNLLVQHQIFVGVAISTGGSISNDAIERFSRYSAVITAHVGLFDEAIQVLEDE